MAEIQRLLTPRETANILGVAVDTLTIWRCTRRVVLPFVKFGRSVRYKPEDVARFVEEKTYTGTAEIAVAGGR